MCRLWVNTLPEHGVPEVWFQELIKFTEVSKEPAIFVFVLKEFSIQLPWERRQYAPPKLWKNSTISYDITSQKFSVIHL